MYEPIDLEMSVSDMLDVSVTAIAEGQVVWQQGFGDAEDQVEAMRYRFGTVSTLVTSIAVMQLVEQGKLSLDEPVTHILPNFKPIDRFNSRAITVKDLLTHHSGLPGDYLAGSRTDDFTDAVKQVNNLHLSYPVGSRYAYSGLAFDVLGAIVEQRSGQRFIDFTQAQIFSPLGFNQTGYEQNFDSFSYREGEEVELQSERDLPAQGLVATTPELARLLLALESGQLLKPETVTQLMTRQNSQVVFDLDESSGLGWFRYPRLVKNGIEVWGNLHQISDSKHRTLMLYLPAYNVGIAMATTSSDAEESLEKLAGEALTHVLAIRDGVSIDDYRYQKQPAKETLSPNLNKLVGDFATRGGLVRNSLNEEDAPIMNVLGYDLNLLRNADNGLTPSMKVFGFISIPLGKYSLMSIDAETINGVDVMTGNIDGYKTVLGNRIEPKPLSNDFSQYYGTWYPKTESPVVDIVKVVIGQRNGYLTSSLSLGSGNTLHYPLKPLSADAAIADGLESYMGEHFKFSESEVVYSGLSFIRKGSSKAQYSKAP